MFLILESDVFILPTINRFNDCINLLQNKEWSAINIGGEFGDMNQVPWAPATIYRMDNVSPDVNLLFGQAKEDLNDSMSDIRFIRKFHTRCTDSQLWSYRGCIDFLKYMKY